MRKVVALAALSVAVSLPSAAAAQIFVGARLGYAVPWGDLMKSWPVTDTVRSQVPVQLDLGLGVGKALAIGAYASYGVGQPAKGWKADCDASDSTCSAGALRIGAQLSLHAAGAGNAGLWGGVAFGYEELRTKDSKGLIPELAFKGYDATLEGGLDLPVSSGLRLGPYVSASAGQFSKVKSAGESEIPTKELHGWIQLGLRGFYAL
ncbi:MAG TPA: hypothetical protein VLT61_16685 [Anaeromyxobacteraceae bacterium]|nr:hypothetical protein [Anaeromyxobacteraceae bacterium]